MKGRLELATIDAAAQQLRAELRQALGDLRVQFARTGAGAEDERALADALAQLDDLFLLVVVGEFNAGKSAFLNALVGERSAGRLLPEGVTPTTDRIHVLRYGEQESRESGPGGIELVRSPAPMLKDLALVDTPGTNAIERYHELLTERFVPRADFVLFVTSADRPFTESERAFLERLLAWGKKIVVVLNKIDLLADDREVREVVSFIEEGCRRLLGFAPVVLPVSARRRLRELQGEATAPSGFEGLERFLRETLDQRERLRLKLFNPLRVAQRLVASALVRLSGQSQELAADVDVLDRLEAQLDAYGADLEREFGFRLAAIDRTLGEVERRGDAFFEETLRLGRLPDLLQRTRVERRFEAEVIADMPQALERQVSELIDWLVASELRQWQATATIVHDRERRLGNEAGAMAPFAADRAELLGSLGRSASEAVDTYDQKREADRLGESLQRAVASAALLEVGAVGLGAIVAAVATSTVADITGILAAGALAALGLFVLPARRRRAKRELERRLAELRERLMAALRHRFRDALDRSFGRLREAVAPYTRFVRAERDRQGQVRTALDHASDDLARLDREIERQFAPEAPTPDS
jgi:small GTP-binding protein